MATAQDERQQSDTSGFPGPKVGTRVAIGLGIGGLVFSAVGPILLTGGAAEILYTVGMVMILAAAVVWVVVRMRHRGEHFTILPTSTVGRWAGGMLVLSIALVLAFLAGAFTSDIAILVAMFVVAGAVTALVAHFRHGDRSAPLVFFSLLLAVFMVYFFAGELAFPH